MLLAVTRFCRAKQDTLTPRFPGQGITQAGRQPPALSAARRAGVAATLPLTPEQLGRIVVARFLELPLRAFERRVRSLEQAPRFRVLRSVMRIESLSGLPPVAAGAARVGNLLGVVAPSDSRPVFRYASPAFDREYRFEEAALARLPKRGDLDLIRLVSRLRLVNTRNRLTHALVQALLEAQREFVLTGDPLLRRPLSQATLSARVRASGTCPVDAATRAASRACCGASPRGSRTGRSCGCGTCARRHGICIAITLPRRSSGSG